MTANDERGLQYERTALAWKRTGMAHVVLAALTLRVLPFHPAGYLLAAAALISAASTWFAARQRTEADIAIRAGWPRNLTSLTLVVALGALAAVVT